MKITVMKEKRCCCNVIEILISISKYINYIHTYIHRNGSFYFTEEILTKRFNLTTGMTILHYFSISNALQFLYKIINLKIYAL